MPCVTFRPLVFFVFFGVFFQNQVRTNAYNNQNINHSSILIMSEKYNEVKDKHLSDQVPRKDSLGLMATAYSKQYNTGVGRGSKHSVAR